MVATSNIQIRLSSSHITEVHKYNSSSLKRNVRLSVVDNPVSREACHASGIPPVRLSRKDSSSLIASTILIDAAGIFNLLIGLSVSSCIPALLAKPPRPLEVQIYTGSTRSTLGCCHSELSVPCPSWLQRGRHGLLSTPMIHGASVPRSKAISSPSSCSGKARVEDFVTLLGRMVFKFFIRQRESATR